MKTNRLPSIFVSTLLALPSAFSSEIPCQREVEKQNEDLASQSSAVREKKSNLIDQIEQGETDLASDATEEVLALLKRSGTLAFSFSNDAGVWLSVVEAKTCGNLLTIKITDL